MIESDVKYNLLLARLPDTWREEVANMSLQEIEED